MISLTYDLHLHSCLSPCGDEDMTPGNIAGMAVVNGLDMVALTDHNTCGNCAAFCRAAEHYGLLALPGMELTSSGPGDFEVLPENIDKGKALALLAEGRP